MKMKLIIGTAMAALAAATLFSAQSQFGITGEIEQFIKRRDGWIVGILGTNGNVSLSSDIKEVTWTAENGASKIIRWDGTNVIVR